MDISIFLAQAFGIFFIIVGAGLIMHPSLMRSIVDKFVGDRDMIVMSGLLTLFIGIPLVLVHNIWDGTWRVIITIIAWLTFLKGVARVLMPDMVLKWGQQLTHKPALVRCLLWCTIVFGLYLLYLGFGTNT